MLAKYLRTISLFLLCLSLILGSPFQSLGGNKNFFGSLPSLHTIEELHESMRPYLVPYQNTYVIYGITPYSSFGTNTKHDDDDGNVFIGIYQKDWTFLRGIVFGGSGFEFPRTLCIDENGIIAIAGGTTSKDFPITSNAFQKTKANDFDYDAFFCCFRYDTLDLIYSTCYGGNATDVITTMIDDGDRYLILGTTESTDLPTTKQAFQSKREGSANLFFTVLSKRFDLLYSSYYGENEHYAENMILHPETGQILIGGRGYIDRTGEYYLETKTQSTPISFQEKPAGWYDGYFLILHPETYHIDYQTYLGKQKDDWIGSMKLLSSTEILFYGNTNSPDFYTTNNAFQKTITGEQQSCFISILDWSQNELKYSSYLGGLEHELSFDCFLVDDGFLVTGLTRSSDFPVSHYSRDKRVMKGRDRSYFVCWFSLDGALLCSSLFHDSNFGMCSKSILQDDALFLFGETQGMIMKGAFMEIPISSFQRVEWNPIRE